MALKKLTKHDKYVLDLCNRLNGVYDRIYTNLLFKNSKRVIAEADVVSTKDDLIDVYEVKCSNRVIKAKKQLIRIKRIMENQSKKFNKDNNEYRLFFYCGSSKELVEIS